MGSWCPAWALDGMGVGRGGLWWVVGDLGRMGYASKLVCEIALEKLGAGYGYSEWELISR